jgi:DNA-binding response OmpR family regulator/signal transduction histidine kinase
MADDRTPTSNGQRAEQTAGVRKVFLRISGRAARYDTWADAILRLHNDAEPAGAFMKTQLASNTNPKVAAVRGNERARILLVSGLIFVVGIMVALVILPPILSAHADNLRGRLETAQRLTDALIEIDDRVQELRVAARSYVITGAPAFREQYEAGRDSMPATLATLAELAPSVQPSLAEPSADLVTAVERWQRDGGDRQVALVQQNRVSDAAALIASGASQESFDTFRARAAFLRDQTNAARAELQDQIDRTRALQVAVTTSLGILGLFAAGLVVVGFRQTLALLRNLEAERSRTAVLADEVRALYETAQTERRRLQTVFDHSPEGIVVADAPQGQIVLANHAADALLGSLAPGTRLDPHPLADRTFLPGGQPCPPEMLPLVQTLSKGVEQRGELIVAREDSRRIPVYITSVPLRGDDGATKGAVAVVQDLRQLREVERLKSDFVALVSHELRTPLTAIKGASQTVLRRLVPPEPERMRDLMRIVDEQSDRLQELIDNLLSLSQLEAGALRLRRETVSLPTLIQGVVRQQRARLAGVRLQTELPHNLPPVSADPRRVEQVLSNLIENACTFSPLGAAVTVSAVLDGTVVRVAVRDHGPGIAPAERERVFERFYQAAQPSTRRTGGTGLGLAICKALVEAHGGRIWADAAPGGGALLQFTLPAVTDEAVQPSVRAIGADPEGQARVLVVDDDPALRRVVTHGLEDAGYLVLAAGEAETALDTLAEHAPDLVLLDVMLPGTDGFALMGQIREWTAVPIIMLTARASEQDVVRGLQRGADDYVTKPFRLSELLARIEAVLRRAQAGPAAGEPTVIENGALTIDLASRRVTVGGRLVTLTPTEYRILVHLARHAGQVLTHEQILQAVWGEGYGSENHYLWVHIAHLRQKIEDDQRPPRYILTERGVGYRMARVS